MKIGDLVQYSSAIWGGSDKEYGIVLSVIDVAPGRKNASYEVYWPNSNSCRWHAEPRIMGVK